MMKERIQVDDMQIMIVNVCIFVFDQELKILLIWLLLLKRRRFGCKFVDGLEIYFVFLEFEFIVEILSLEVCEVFDLIVEQYMVDLDSFKLSILEDIDSGVYVFVS